MELYNSHSNKDCNYAQELQERLDQEQNDLLFSIQLQQEEQNESQSEEEIEDVRTLVSHLDPKKILW
jgi:hypothetical protein